MIGVIQKKQGYEYSRSLNPTRKAFETAVAALEHAPHGTRLHDWLQYEIAVQKSHVLIDIYQKMINSAGIREWECDHGDGVALARQRTARGVRQ